MILPQSYGLTLLVMILSVIFLGSWANFLKAPGRWRFELFYLDFTIGMLLLAIVAALTLGSLGFDGFSLADDLSHAGKREWMFAFLAGFVFNLGNMLITSSVAVAGMAVAFPVGLGVTIIVTMLVGLANGTRMQTGFVLLGVFAMFLAVIVDGFAWRATVKARRAAAPPEGKKKRSRGAGAAKALVLAIVGGLVMTGMYPLLVRAAPPEVGLGPYSLAMVFAIGALVSTILGSIFFMNLPVEGPPLGLRDYLSERPGWHLLGFLSGAMLCAGLVGQWVATSVPPQAQIGRMALLGMSQSGTVVATLWGILLWKDFRGTSGAAKAMGLIVVLLYAGGLVLLSLAVPATAGR